MFVLATTDPQKLISTIRSRATGVQFARAGSEEIERSLKKVIKGEKLKVDKEVPEIIARFSDGSFRDAQKNLEQLMSEKVRLTKNKVSEYLSGKGSFDVKHFVENLSRRNTKDSINEVEKAVESGTSVKSIVESIVTYLRSIMLAKVGIGGEDFRRLNTNEVKELLKLFSEAASKVPLSFIEQVPLEIAIVEWCEDGGGDSSLNGNGDGVEKQGSDKSNAKSEDLGKVKSKTSSSEISEPEERNFKRNGISEDEWVRILKELRPRNSSTEALLRAAKPVGFDGKTLKLGVFYSFHKEKLEGNPHRLLLEEVVGLVKGDDVRIECLLTKPPEKKVVIDNTSETVTPKAAGSSNDLGSKHAHVDKKISQDVILTESGDEDIIKVAKEIFDTD